MNIIQIDKVSDENYQKITEGFYQQALEKRGSAKPAEKLTLEMVSDDGGFIGAIICDIFYGCLYIDILFVEKSFRGRGYGSKLL